MDNLPSVTALHRLTVHSADLIKPRSGVLSVQLHAKHFTIAETVISHLNILNAYKSAVNKSGIIMEYKYIKYSVEDGVKKITLNRPGVLNSFTLEMGQELVSAIESTGEDQSVRAVLLSGEGRAFSAGQDLNEALPAMDDEKGLGKIVRTLYNPIILSIRKLEKPVVCAVNGVAAGAGANIAFACDIVLASESAAFIQSFSKIGLIPDSGGTYFLPRIMGVNNASALMMLGEKIPAKRAMELGMVYKVFPDEQLMQEALSVASTLANMPTRALGMIKRALNVSLLNDLETQLDLEARLQTHAGQTEDFKEGVNAFLEKRSPDFKGK